MGTQRLAISVENHSPQYARALDEARLPYHVFKSSRRWVYLTDYLPSPVAEATARFLSENVLPEMLLEHIDTSYQDIPEEDRLAIFQDNLDYLRNDQFTRGTQALIQPSLEENRALSIEGWLRFRGQDLVRVIARLAHEGLRSLRLERAYRQFRTLCQGEFDHLIVEGEGAHLRIKDPSGIELFTEFLEGYLDPRLQIDREDLACSLLQAIRPERLELVNVSPDLRRRLQELRLY